MSGFDFDDHSFSTPASGEHLLKGLNAEQRQAVTLPDAHALILAADV